MMKRESGDARQRFFEAMKGLKGAELQVGFFPSAKYTDKETTPVAYVAAVHEFGSPARSIPPRPFFRPTIADRQKVWKNAIGRFSKSILAGDMTAPQALEQLGLAVAGDIKKTISKIQTPELKEKTIVAKRRKLAASGKDMGNLYKPLIESSQLIDSVIYEVTQK